MSRTAAFVLAVAVALGSVLASPPPAAAQPSGDRVVPQDLSEVHLSFAPVVRAAAPAVVNIYARRIVADRRAPRLSEHPFFQEFFGQRRRQRVQNSLGSGVIVQDNGLIVTNQHVVEGADEIVAVLRDGRELGAEVIYADRGSDIAILRAQDAPRDLTALQFGDSDSLAVGDVVLAIGNPFGVGQTTTLGIVSATSRAIGGRGQTDIYIQTDAAINPGNSGGALVTLDGKLIGINTAIFSQSGGNQGIGFAVPSNLVRTFVENLENGRVRRPWLGLTAQPVTGEMAGSLGLKRATGVLVESLVDGAPAEAAGLNSGDVVLGVDGHEVGNLAALRYRLATRAEADTLTLTVLKNGQRRRVDVPVRIAPNEPPAAPRRLGGRQPLAGARVANLNPMMLVEHGLNRAPGQVLVLEVAAGSHAANVGVEPGDVLTAINGRSIETVRDLQRVIDRTALPWRLGLVRDGQDATIRIR